MKEKPNVKMASSKDQTTRAVWADKRGAFLIGAGLVQKMWNGLSVVGVTWCSSPTFMCIIFVVLRVRPIHVVLSSGNDSLFTENLEKKGGCERMGASHSRFSRSGWVRALSQQLLLCDTRRR